MKNLLDQNKTKIVPIKYQTSWPGVDPMNAHNPTQVASRVSYYTISGVPGVRMDGNVVSGAPSSITQANINARQAVASAFAMRVSKNITGNTINVQTVIRKVAATTTALQAHVVVVEREINFLTAPGLNGEKEFNNVMKQMLPNASGTTVAGTLAVGDSVVLNHSWVMTNVYNISNIEVIAFLQNNANREIFQGAYTALTPSNGNDGSLSRFVGSTASPNCANALSPTFRLFNAGNTPITSAVFNYSVNGGLTQQSTQTLNIAPLGTTTITLPGIPANTGSNTVNATISLINGGTDGFTSNNAVSYSINYAPPTVVSYTVPSDTFLFEIATDRYGDETRWSVVNNLGNVLYSGGPYALQGANGVFPQPSAPMVLPVNQCVQLQINDSYGDGMCCTYGNGYYRLRNSANTIVFQGGSFQSVSNRFVNLQAIVQSISDKLTDEYVEVYPNPTNGLMNIQIKNSAQTPVTIQVYSTLGALVQGSLLSKQQERFESQLDLSTLDNGVYFVHIIQDGNRSVKRVILSR